MQNDYDNAINSLSRLQEFLNNVLSIVMTPNMLIFGHSENVYLAQLWLKFNTMTFLAIRKLNDTNSQNMSGWACTCMSSLFLFQYSKLLFVPRSTDVNL